MSEWRTIGTCGPFTYAEPPERFVLKWTDHSDPVVYRIERTCRFLPAAGDENKPFYEQEGNCSRCFGMMYGYDSYCPDCGAKVVSE